MFCREGEVVEVGVFDDAGFRNGFRKGDETVGRSEERKEGKMGRRERSGRIDGRYKHANSISDRLSGADEAE